jgi:hypothetical protein
MNLSLLCIAAAVVVFAFAAAGVTFGVAMVPLGLSLFAAGHLPLP